MMEFTYESYINMIELLKSNNYRFSNYHYKDSIDRLVILRHDVDFSLEKALEIAKIENKLGVKSTFFILLSTNFYNIFSKTSQDIINEIKNQRHEIGLHFDEVKYEVSSVQDLKKYVEFERKLLESAVGNEVKSVSMHRPSKWILSGNVEFLHCVNSYSNEFFHDFKYISDSRMNWREDVLDIIKKETHNKLHILTHPFWYSNDVEDMKCKLINFADSAKKMRILQMSENFTDLESVIGKDVYK